VTSATVQVIAIAAGWSVAVGLAGALLAWRLRRRSVRWLAAVLGIVAVMGVAAGVVGTARAMFLSDHDLGVVITVCGVSGLVSIAFALWVGERLGGAARRLRDAAIRFGDGGEFLGPDDVPREFEDISVELTRSGERLHEAAERERRLEESRRQLVAWVSHDLRTPLAGIRAMAEAFEDGIAVDSSRYHALMRTEIDRMVVMVDDLFELSRIHAGTLQLTMESVELSDVVSDVIAEADPIARAKRVRLGGQVDTRSLVHADAGALARVVSNLVMNAIRHTPADGAVVVEATAAEHAMTLSVTDACGGIAEDDLARVFDVAWRSGTARTPGADIGAGLGLAIVKGLVEAHHGTVTVRNHHPGCRFVVTIPV
jgi:signal transduction histidine kinase